jgi:hypothetical protein
MGLDVRLPLGFMFVTIGLLLTGYGALAADTAGAGLNIGWGLVLLAFGLLLLWLSRRGSRSRTPNT